MPLTGSMVLSTQNSGAIWTRPPIDTTIRMPISSRNEFLSKVSCFMARPLFSRHGPQAGSGGDAGLIGDIDRLIAAHRAPDVVSHDQRAEDEQQAADGADHVVGLHRLHGLDERVLQEAELVVGAPHEA